MNLKKILIFNSLIFSILVFSGFFGFNVDIGSYYFSPNTPYRHSEFIGGYIATLRVGAFYLGPFLSSLIVSLGLAYFLINLPKLFIGSNNKILSIITIHLLFLISWPIFVGSTNSLRQVVALGFLLFLLGLMLNKNKKFTLIFITSLLVWFSHRFGKFNLIVIYYSFFINYFFFYFKINFKITYLITVFFSALVSIVILYFNFAHHGDNYVTGLDLLIPLYLIFSSSNIFLFLITKLNYNERLLSLIFINLTVFTTIIFFNNSILYERINWLTFILSIFIFSSLLARIIKTNINYNIIGILILLSIMTFLVHFNDNRSFYDILFIKLEKKVNYDF